MEEETCDICGNEFEIGELEDGVCADCLADDEDGEFDEEEEELIH